MADAFEYADERFESAEEAGRYWLACLDAAETAEADWHNDAKRVVEIYEGRRQKQDFNILHSNAQVIVSASYNATPIPDIRPRYLDGDPLARAVGDIQERAISYGLDQEAFDPTLTDVVLQAYVAGRGQARVLYVPHMHTDMDQQTGQPVEQVVFEETPIEIVHWADYRQAPAPCWAMVNWVGFRKRLTRAEIDDLTGDPTVSKDLGFKTRAETGEHDADPNAGAVGKAEIWEIWDRDARLVWWFSKATAKVIAVDQDPFGLPEFYPCPRPLLYVERLDHSAPIAPYTVYEAQAEELENTSERIRKLTAALKYRGIYAAEIEEFGNIQNLDDNEFAPSQGALSAMMAGGGAPDLDRALWTQPLDRLIQVLRELTVMREQQKSVIYELSGIADIMRGESNAQETLGAQQIKARWGSLRIQRFQGEVQRFCRDLFRIKAFFAANLFSDTTLTAINGKPVDPQVLQALRSDSFNRLRVDIETDSTVRGDLNRIQQEQTNFLQAVGQFISTVGPVIKTPQNPGGVLPAEAAVTIFSAFARSFRLGREVEDMLETLKQGAAEMQQPDPAQEAAKQVQVQKAQAEAAKTAAEAEREKIGVVSDQVDMQAQQVETAAVAAGQMNQGFTP